jgi:hypothetical protein
MNDHFSKTGVTKTIDNKHDLKKAIDNDSLCSSNRQNYTITEMRNHAIHSYFRALLLANQNTNMMAMVQGSHSHATTAVPPSGLHELLYGMCQNPNHSHWHVQTEAPPSGLP